MDGLDTWMVEWMVEWKVVGVGRVSGSQVAVAAFVHVQRNG